MINKIGPTTKKTLLLIVCSFIILVVLIILLVLAFIFLFPLMMDSGNANDLKSQITLSDKKFTKELWLRNAREWDQYGTRLEIFKDLSTNHLKKGVKYEMVEGILGEKPLYYRIYDGLLYKRKCKQYFLGQEASFGAVSIYLVICPDKSEQYIEDVFTIYHKSFTWTFDSGVEVENKK